MLRERNSGDQPGAGAETRSKRADPEWSQMAILDAAYALFSVHGFASTTVAGIAERAGVAKGLVLFHYKTKEGILRNVIERSIQTLLEGIEAPDRDDPLPSEDVLRQTLRRIYRNLVERPEAEVILRLLIAEGRRHPELTAYYHDAVVERGTRTIAEIVERGHGRGEFRLEGTEQVARILLDPVIGTLFRRMLFDESDPGALPAQVEQHVDIMLNGLSASSPRSKKG